MAEHQFYMNYLIKTLLVVTCILQTTTLYAQSILNQYDEQGNKHGQWIEDDIVGRKSIYNYNHDKKEGLSYVYDYGNLSYVGEYDDDKHVSYFCFDRGVLMYDFYDFEYGDIQIDHLRFIGKCKGRAYHPNGVIKRQFITYFDEGGPEMDTAFSPEISYYDESGYLYKVEYYATDYLLSAVWHYDKSGNITKKESEERY